MLPLYTRTDITDQIVYIPISLLLKEQSDQDLHYLPFRHNRSTPHQVHVHVVLTIVDKYCKNSVSVC